jgi:3-dehydroquinate synthase
VPEPSSIDIPFSVPFVHRLRFTRDVLGDDWEVLAAVLEPSEGQISRVQVWMDEHLIQADAGLAERIERTLARVASQVLLTGPIQRVTGGEEIKNSLPAVERILGAIHAAGLDRRSYVVVIGGGAVLDAVGFAAAVAHRGIRLVRLPTSTLAQADSGVGVKNSVNLFHTKNWLGTFAVPWTVINDARLLESQSDRDFVCGFAESVKVSLLKDAALFDELCRCASRIRRREMEAALPIIRRSALLHLEHITRGGDPFETQEARPLDFGHWSAHKLEAMTEFRLRHGEAVAIGVAIDTVYSSLVHGLPARVAERVLDCLSELGLPLNNPALADTQTLFAGLEEFRQHLGGRFTLTMLRGLGEPLNVHDLDRRRMTEAIQRVVAFADAGMRGAGKS